MAAARPLVFKYENYRLYLKDYYGFMKAESKTFSYREFSRLAGFASPNFIKLVIDGKRNLTKNSLRKLGQALKLPPEENTFFRNLVFFNQAGNSGERRQHAEKLHQSEVFRGLYPLKQAQFDYYRKWFYIPIREMVASPHFDESPEWIAKHLGGKIEPEDARQAIHDLQSLGLIARDSSGRLRQANANVTTGSEVQSAGVAEFHRQMMALAGRSIDEVARYRREISGITVLVTEDEFAKLKRMTQEFRQSLLAEIGQGSGGASARVYQLAFQLFPLSETLEAAPEDEDGKGDDTCKKAS